MIDYLKYIDDDDKRRELLERISAVQEYEECLEILREDRQVYRVTGHWTAEEICCSFIDNRLCREYVKAELERLKASLINDFGIKIDRALYVRHKSPRRSCIDGQISIEEYLRTGQTISEFIDRVEKLGIPYTVCSGGASCEE